MTTKQFIITQCGPGIAQTRETIIGESFITTGKFKDVTYPFDIGDQLSVPDAHYILGPLNEVEFSGGRMIYDNIQVGIENGKVWYKEGWMTDEKAVKIFSALHSAGIIDAAKPSEGDPKGKFIQKVLEFSEDYEALAKIHPSK